MSTYSASELCLDCNVLCLIERWILIRQLSKTGSKFYSNMADPSGPMRTLTLIQNTADHYIDKCFHSHTNSENRLLTFVLCFAKIMLFVCEYKIKSFRD